MAHTITTSREFDEWYQAQNVEAQDEIAAMFTVLREEGPNLSSLFVKKVHNMKPPGLRELRINIESRPIRIMFIAVSPQRLLILFGGDKGGKGNRWYTENAKQIENIYKRIIKEGK